MKEIIPDALDNERVDRVISMILGVSRSTAATAVSEGLVTLDGKSVSKVSQRVTIDQELEVEDSVFDSAPDIAPDPDVELNYVHIDDDVVVVAKSAGRVVHPGAGHSSGTLAQGLLARFPEIASVGDPGRPGIVHRLDKGTSGVLMAARSVRAYESLTEQLRNRTVTRRYTAIAWGIPDSPRGVVEAPIGRAVRDPTRMVVREDGKSARTSYSVLASWTEPKVSLLSCVLDTGRTHQIRVHLEAINHPVVGDNRYGRGRGDLGIDRPALHAAELGFTHPATGERLEFADPLPDDISAIIEAMGTPATGEVPR